MVDAAAIAYFEKMPFADALYFSFVTGLTIGYGDIAPVALAGRVVAILTGLVGILITGLIGGKHASAASLCVQSVRHHKDGGR